ncbi:peptide ABC transporter ATP-binding protein [Acetobacter nitrogenifigens DSM 23921 = NBRC 105050]|uniref:ABC transporter ATP-binding protein n=1 Tax=Acetobacter nitrogenifigens DSM 23921 = NBRC 105050 TaxID=1120919 RepID=A0A511XBN3_9PROT|nr:ABC transporter ATP-binding protein [Acetobacter nitrogenifigens]GBQ90429.1 peptide ABC transporter ATP-binding protein [Acetobacter nitrogenifigens DSM 23921 = NBRC 105050]GEN60350.1 ABC transporter ATP-binding protein [Acetobacter nitrogenifigens DSM 23921 = NBRC 105050]
MTLLAVRDLGVDFGGPPIVDGVSFSMKRGEIVALVGESGSGKSVASLALMGLLGRGNVTGSAILRLNDGRETDLARISSRERRGVLGRHVSMIFQDPLSSLDPIQTIGAQMREVLSLHCGLRGGKAQARAIELLHEVGIVDPQACLKLIPQRLSGGMRQRVLIAMAIAGEPELLLADEPTTALDVTVQAQVLRLLLSLRARSGMGMIFITHNLAVASSIADRVIVLYAGQVVEDAPADAFFAAPAMPYSKALLGAAPGIDSVFGARRLPILRGQVPAPGERGVGCRFAPRCDAMRPTPCQTQMPDLLNIADGENEVHAVRCGRWEELAR